MRILYLTHPEDDYGEYFLFNGLCQVHGPMNIVTYPFKKTYYGQIADDYILDNGDTGFTSPGAYITKRELNVWDMDEIVDRISEFDFIVLSSGRTYAVNALRELIKRFGKCPLPLIFTEHEDGENVRTDIIEEFHPDLVFKREILKESKVDVTGIIPLPFSSALDSFPEVDDTDKKYSVFGAFGNTYPIRRETAEKLLELNYDNSYVSLDSKVRGDYQENNKQRLSYAEYLTKIAQSKIAVVVRGHGRDTVRYWEVPAFETLMLVCYPGLRIPNDFIDGETAVFFKEDLSDLKEKIDYYLENDEERIRIARAGKEHLLKYHTNKARAEYFMDIVKEREVFE